MKAVWQRQQPPKISPKKWAFCKSPKPVKNLMPGSWCLLDEYPRWGPGGLHCPFLLQWMFTHAEATGWKKHDCAIWWDHQLSSPKQDLSVGVLQLSSWASRSPGKRSEGCTTKYTNWKGHLEWNCAMQRWQRVTAKKSSTLSRSASVTGGTMPSQWRARLKIHWHFQARPLSKFQHKTHSTYDHFQDLKRGHAKRP